MSERHQNRVASLVGPGRAGATVAAALVHSGWRLAGVVGRFPGAPSALRIAELVGAMALGGDEAVHNAEMVLIAVPDGSVADVSLGLADSLRHGALVVHLAGSFGPEVFEPLRRTRPDLRFGSLHPLQSLPYPSSLEDAVARLEGSWCAITGDSQLETLARELGMQPFAVDSTSRGLYHAAATVASNHLVALAGQVERLAAQAGVPVAAFLPLMRTTIENIALLGPADALTGPVARGDVATVAHHLDAIPPSEQPGYRAMAREALKLIHEESPGLSALLTGDAASDAKDGTAKDGTDDAAPRSVGARVGA